MNIQDYFSYLFSINQIINPFSYEKILQRRLRAVAIWVESAPIVVPCQNVGKVISRSGKSKDILIGSFDTPHKWKAQWFGHVWYTLRGWSVKS